MTLEEAIKHCEDVADYDCFTDDQRKCSDEHRQLADWLRVLKSELWRRYEGVKRMSVLIKDMEKPKSCYAVIDGEAEFCPFVNTDDDCVLLLKKGICVGTWADQYSKCPLAEEPERKKGRWIYGEKSGQDGWYCSECGGFIPWYYDFYGLDNIDFIEDFKTCPFCDSKMVSYTGADMREGEEDE